jgi:hypothetical protein
MKARRGQTAIQGSFLMVTLPHPFCYNSSMKSLNIGIDTFSELISEGCLYVIKTTENDRS